MSTLFIAAFGAVLALFGPGTAWAGSPVLEQLKKWAGAEAQDVAPPGVVPFVAVKATPEGRRPRVPIDWVLIKGGSFRMGREGDHDAMPVHEVTVKDFQLSKTPVTVAQYRDCIYHGDCTLPDSGGVWRDCLDWQDHQNDHRPVNCVDWIQANQYAKFQNARLPSEAEWEYAARSEGKDRSYPWGNDPPTQAHAPDPDLLRYPPAVCSYPAGNTEQGLCDMAGYVGQWVQDYYNPYATTPRDGSASTLENVYRVVRGGLLANGQRGHQISGVDESHMGFRIAR